MGGKICCTSGYHDEQPFTHRVEGYKRENIRFHIKESQKSGHKINTAVSRKKPNQSKLLDIF